MKQEAGVIPASCYLNDVRLMVKFITITMKS